MFVLDSNNFKHPSKLEEKFFPLTGDSLILVCPAVQLTNTCTKRMHVQKYLLADNCNILKAEDTADTLSDESCMLNVYRVVSSSSRTSADARKTCSRLLNAMDSLQW